MPLSDESPSPILQPRHIYLPRLERRLAVASLLVQALDWGLVQVMTHLVRTMPSFPFTGSSSTRSGIAVLESRDELGSKSESGEW